MPDSNEQQPPKRPKGLVFRIKAPEAKIKHELVKKGIVPSEHRVMPPGSVPKTTDKSERPETESEN